MLFSRYFVHAVYLQCLFVWSLLVPPSLGGTEVPSQRGLTEVALLYWGNVPWVEYCSVCW